MLETDPFLSQPIHRYAIDDVLDELSLDISPTEACRSVADAERLQILPEEQRPAVAYLATTRAVEIQEEAVLKKLRNVLND